MVKTLNLVFDDDEFEKLKKQKENMDDSPSWKDFFRRGVSRLERGSNES